IDSLKDAARSRRPVLLEGNWRHKDGRYVSLEMSLRHAYGLNGRVAETIAMARNVEARNELRDKLTRAAQTDHLTGLGGARELVARSEEHTSELQSLPTISY